MKVSEVQIGKTYTARITDRVVPVRLEAEHPSGGWRATNLATNKQVRIKSATKLREEVQRSNASEEPAASAEQKDESNPKPSKRNSAPGSKPKKSKVGRRKIDDDSVTPSSTSANAETSPASSSLVSKKEPPPPEGPPPEAPSESPEEPDESPDPSADNHRSPAKPTWRRPGRISLTHHGDRERLTKIIAELPTSRDHIAFTQNGKLYELYFRSHNGSPAVWKAHVDSPIDEKGYRSEDASLLVTGVAQVTHTIKQATGKRPSQIQIRLGNWMGGKRGDGKTARPGNSGTPGNSGNPGQTASEGMSLLDAAVKVLGEARGKPLSCREMIERILNKGYWSSLRGGKTPAATLSSAILREVQARRKQARFVKIARGQFAVRKEG